MYLCYLGGTVLVLNNLRYRKARSLDLCLDDRKGAENDTYQLQQAFSTLGFEVFILHNLTGQVRKRVVSKNSIQTEWKTCCLTLKNQKKLSTFFFKIFYFYWMVFVDNDRNDGVNSFGGQLTWKFP